MFQLACSRLALCDGKAIMIQLKRLQSTVFILPQSAVCVTLTM